MGRVRVKMNKLPRVIDQIPKQADNADARTADSMLAFIQANIWYDTGVVLSTAKDVDENGAHWVRVGVLRQRGFYALFLENGTVKMQARPLVRPTAHAHEPIHASNHTTALKRACRV